MTSKVHVNYIVFLFYTFFNIYVDELPLNGWPATLVDESNAIIT